MSFEDEGPMYRTLVDLAVAADVPPCAVPTEGPYKVCMFCQKPRLNRSHRGTGWVCDHGLAWQKAGGIDRLQYSDKMQEYDETC